MVWVEQEYNCPLIQLPQCHPRHFIISWSCVPYYPLVSSGLQGEFLRFLMACGYWRVRVELRKEEAEDWLLWVSPKFWI
jgi:hypothetical protein